jgi:hypothetical protein
MTDGDFVGRYTDWSPYDTPTIAGFFDEDLSTAWSQVWTWEQTHQLVSRHHDVLRSTRESLAHAWPPERSPAAQAFFSVIDELVSSIDEMRGVALTNGSSLHGVLTSLDEAKRTVDGLHEQWRVADAVESAKGEYYDPGPQADVDLQAQATMRTLDQAVIEYYPYLSSPTPYSPPAIGDPPPTPVSGDVGPSGPSARGGTSRHSPRPPAIPPVPPLERPGTSGPQPVLSGGPSGSGGFPIGGEVYQPSAPTPVGPEGGPSPGAWFVDTPGGRALRSGGVIGYVPDDPLGPAKEMTDQVHAAGQGPAEEATARMGQPLGGYLPGQAGAGPRQSRKRTLPPDTKWEVAGGVPPVLLPPPEPVHDPGPGVIGIDR